MSKIALLTQLTRWPEADAEELAAALGLAYPATAMALLRAWRQGLLGRDQEPESGRYVYWLTDHGRARWGHLKSLNRGG